MPVISYQQEAHGVFATRLYEKAECASIVEQVKDLEAWEPAQIVVESEVGTQDLLMPETRSASIVRRARAAEIHDQFEENVSSTVSPMIKEIWGVELPNSAGTQIVRYSPGGHYVAHRDANEQELANRYFTVLCYLNDGFEGGKTSFQSLHFAATPVAGKTLVFPSRYWHCAEPVTKGEKFVFVTWMCGPLPIKWI
jgi:predicted 2-oxoglutarate/Fe(II)-dependent dioxygenase YbiX